MVSDWNSELSDIISGIDKGKYRDEAAVSRGIVMRLLTNLAWEPFDTEIVIPEYSLGAKKVDYALCPTNPQSPKVIIEVKAIGNIQGADEQLFRYAFNLGGDIIAVLTDGKTWCFYYVAGSGDIENRKVCSLDLTKDNPEYIKEKMERYLSFNNVSYGKSAGHAKDDWNKSREEKTIPQVFAELVREQDNPIIDLIIERCRKKDVIIHDKKSIVSYLSDIVSVNCGSSKTNEEKYFQTTEKVEYYTDNNDETIGKDAVKKKQTNRTSFFQFPPNGRSEYSNAIEMQVALFNELENKFPGFLDRYFENDFNKANKRFHISKNKNAFDNGCKPLIKDYFINSCTSNPLKINMIKHACEILNIKYDSDLIININNM